MIDKIKYKRALDFAYKLHFKQIRKGTEIPYFSHLISVSNNVIENGGNHSLFALKLIDTLKNNDNVINSQILFENIRRYVVANADQTPERAMVHKTGHDGGDFLFFPK